MQLDCISAPGCISAKLIRKDISCNYSKIGKMLLQLGKGGLCKRPKLRIKFICHVKNDNCTKKYKAARSFYWECKFIKARVTLIPTFVGSEWLLSHSCWVTSQLLGRQDDFIGFPFCSNKFQSIQQRGVFIEITSFYTMVIDMIVNLREIFEDITVGIPSSTNNRR